jgi:hypothetical protein
MAMTPKIGQYLNRTVLVSIPALFDDGACRAYKLLGFELQGLWLQSDDLTQRLLSEDKRNFASTEPVVFVPFAQIAGVLVPMTVPTDISLGGMQAPSASAPPAAGKPGASSAGSTRDRRSARNKKNK